MRHLHKSIEVKAPVERVFEFLTTPTNLPAVWPGLVDVTSVVRTSDGSNSFDWTYKMAGMPFTGHSKTIEVETNARIITQNEGGIPSTFRFAFERKGAATRLSVDVEYTIPMPVIGKLAEAVVAKMNEHELGTLLANIKATLDPLPQMNTGKPAQAHV